MTALTPRALVQVSLREWNQDERFGAFGGSHAMVSGGYGQITDAYAAALKDVRTGCPVQLVRYGQGGNIEGGACHALAGLMLNRHLDLHS